VFISAISVWKWSLLVSKGRLELSQELHRSVAEALENIRCQYCLTLGDFNRPERLIHNFR
jgi:PIN domain nuclease of toxin-antitoxin system